MTVTAVVLGCVCGRKWEHTCPAWPVLTGLPDTTVTASPGTGPDSAPDPDAAIVQAIVGLPARLRAHRTQHDLTFRELARRVGLSFSTLHRIESGGDYTVDTLILVAAYLEEQDRCR